MKTKKCKIPDCDGELGNNYRYCSNFCKRLAKTQTGKEYRLNNIKKQEERFCQECGISISPVTTKSYCNDCRDEITKTANRAHNLFQRISSKEVKKVSAAPKAKIPFCNGFTTYNSKGWDSYDV